MYKVGDTIKVEDKNDGDFCIVKICEIKFNRNGGRIEGKLLSGRWGGDSRVGILCYILLDMPNRTYTLIEDPNVI